jgi:hypothetical protein
MIFQALTATTFTKRWVRVLIVLLCIHDQNYTPKRMRMSIGNFLYRENFLKCLGPLFSKRVNPG